MASKLEKMYCELQNEYIAKMEAAFKEKFAKKLKTSLSLLSMELVSTLEGGGDFTIDEHAFISGYSAGYGQAVNIVLFRDNDDQYNAEMRRQAKEAANA